MMDALTYAIQMELEGEKYYTEQAAASLQHNLRIVFSMLAEDEKNHATILKSKLEGQPYELHDTGRPPIKNVFAGMADFKIDIKKFLEQVDLYRLALEKEKQSIELYQKLLLESPDDMDLFEYLIKQEQGHYALLEEIIKMVNRPNEWVESAEFGVREEY
jgi:rubrerythrin